MKKVNKKKAKTKAAPKVEQSLVLNTRAGEMPNPAARNGPNRKDVRLAFR